MEKEGGGKRMKKRWRKNEGVKERGKDGGKKVWKEEEKMEKE